MGTLGEELEKKIVKPKKKIFDEESAEKLVKAALGEDVFEGDDGLKSLGPAPKEVLSKQKEEKKEEPIPLGKSSLEREKHGYLVENKRLNELLKDIIEKFGEEKFSRIENDFKNGKLAGFKDYLISEDKIDWRNFNNQEQAILRKRLDDANLVLKNNFEEKLNELSKTENSKKRNSSKKQEEKNKNKDPIPLGKSSLEKDEGKSDEREGGIKLDYEKFKAFLENKNTKFPIEFISLDGEKYIAIVGYDKNKDEAEVVEGKTKGKNRGKKRRILLSNLIEELKFYNPKDEELKFKIDPDVLSNKNNNPTQVKEKSPSTPEKMQEKLDSLKSDYKAKEEYLEKFKAEHPDNIDEIGRREKELKDLDEEIKENLKYFDVSREAAKITFDRLRDQTPDLEGKMMGGYEDINAETRKEADEKFKQKTRELWKDLVVHGSVKWDEEKKDFVFRKSGDLDVKCCLGLLKKAGINTDYVEYVEQGKFVQGKINIDTGNRDGVIVENDGTAFFDHHDPNSPRNVSSAARIYETMVKLGMIEEDEGMQKMFNFVNEFENGVYKNLDSYYDNSWKTVRGLRDFINYENLVKFFTKNNNPDPYRELSAKELKEYGLYFKKKDKNGKERPITEIVEENVKKDYETLDKLKKDGFIIDSEKYGKIVVDIEGKIKGGFFASRAFGANTYINWNPKIRSFFISSERELEENFPQGIKVRGTMLIKPRGDAHLMKMTLEDVLRKMIGEEKVKEILKEEDKEGKLKHDELIKFFEKEFDESQKWKEEIKTEEEKKKKEEKKWKIETHIQMAEEIFQRAKEEYQISRLANRMNARGYSPYEDLYSGDDYSLWKRVKRRNYEETKAELERLREIAKDPEKKKQFEEHEKRRAEGKIRESEIENEFGKAEEELNEARAEYIGMMEKKRGMWKKMKNFFGNRESIKINKETEEKTYFGPKEDNDVEFYKKIYKDKLKKVKELGYEHVKNKGRLSSKEDIKKELSKIRDYINLTEAAKFLTGHFDAEVKDFSQDSRLWKVVWEKKPNWFLRLPDKFADLSAKMDNLYFGTKNLSQETYEKKQKSQQRKTEKSKIKEKNKEIKNLNEVSSFVAPKDILRDVRTRISSFMIENWGRISGKLVLDKEIEDESIKRATKNFIKDCKKAFGEDGKPKVAETMEAYTRRMTIMLVRKRKEINI
jgi:hypothetical protein